MLISLSLRGQKPTTNWDYKELNQQLKVVAFVWSCPVNATLPLLNISIFLAMGRYCFYTKTDKRKNEHTKKCTSKKVKVTAR